MVELSSLMTRLDLHTKPHVASCIWQRNAHIFQLLRKSRETKLSQKHNNNVQLSVPCLLHLVHMTVYYTFLVNLILHPILSFTLCETKHLQYHADVVRMHIKPIFVQDIAELTY